VRKLYKSLFKSLFTLIVLVIIIPGCFSLGLQHSGMSREERAASEAARKVFRSELKKAISEADEIKVFAINSGEKEAVPSLVRHYKKGQPVFEMLMGVYLEATEKGVVVGSPADRLIVLLSGGSEIYRFEYCNIDGRITSKKVVNGKQGVLFIPENLTSYCM